MPFFSIFAKLFNVCVNRRQLVLMSASAFNLWCYVALFEEYEENPALC